MPAKSMAKISTKIKSMAALVPRPCHLQPPPPLLRDLRRRELKISSTRPLLLPPLDLTFTDHLLHHPTLKISCWQATDDHALLVLRGSLSFWPKRHCLGGVEIKKRCPRNEYKVDNKIKGSLVLSHLYERFLIYFNFSIDLQLTQLKIEANAGFIF